MSRNAASKQQSKLDKNLHLLKPPTLPTLEKVLQKPGGAEEKAKAQPKKTGKVALRKSATSVLVIAKSAVKPRKRAASKSQILSSGAAVLQDDGSYLAQTSASFAQGEFSFANFDPHGADAFSEAAEMQSEIDAVISSFNASIDADVRINSYDYIVNEPPKNIDWSRSDVSICDSWFVPHSLENVVDNKAAIALLDRWIALWCAKPLILPRCCAALLRGPPGVGKTTSVRLALQKHGFNNIIEINASAERSKRLVQRIFALMQQYSVNDQRTGQRTAIVLEEIDGLSDCSRAEKKSNASALSAASAIGSISNASASPVNAKKFRASRKGKATAPARSAEDVVWNAPASGAEALIAFLNSAGLVPQNCDARSVERESAAAVGEEPWCAFRSPVPIIMLANDCSYSFLKRVSALHIRFENIAEDSILQRIVRDLSDRLNLVWTKPSSADYFKDVPLYKVLAMHASGDMRKAIMLMIEAVRAAYSRRMQLPEASSERQNSRLVIRTVDCVAFFGRSREDVFDAPPSLFGAARFVLCQAECVCKHACSCKQRLDFNQKKNAFNLHPNVGALAPQKAICDIHTIIENATNGCSGQRSTVWQQLQKAASNNQITMLPEMIFENYLLCTAEPKRVNDAHCRLAASTVRRQEAMWHSMAEAVRSDYAFLTNETMRDLHSQLGTVATALVVRYPEKYVRDIPIGLVERPASLSRFGALNLQKPAIDGENGNACGTMSKARKERNAYSEFFQLPYQQSLDAWYDWDNYVSNVGQTRGQKNMLSCAATMAANEKTALVAARKRKTRHDDSENESDDADSDGIDADKTARGCNRGCGEKMSEEERVKLKMMIKRASDMDAARLSKESKSVTVNVLSSADAKNFFFQGAEEFTV